MDERVERRAPGREVRDGLLRALAETGSDWTVVERDEQGPGWAVHLHGDDAERVAERAAQITGLQAVVRRGPMSSVVVLDPVT